MICAMDDTQQMASGGVRIYRGEYASHAHDFAQVLFGLSGCLELDLEGRAARVDGTTGLIVPAGVMHSYRTGADTQVWVVDATQHGGLEKLRAFQLPLRWQASADSAQLLDGIADAPRVLQRRALSTDRLHEVVLTSLHEHWPITRMAALYSLSVPQFHRRWKELTGESPQRWLRGIRLERARTLLQAGLPLDVVAPQTGYGSASALCQALQRVHGGGVRQLRRTPR